MNINRVLAVLALVVFCRGTAGAQVISIKKVGDKTVMCMHSGLTSTLNDCGARPDSYTYAFVGLISAVAPIENDEKEIQIVPEEVFLGEPATPLKVLTSQADCLHELKVGDRWLFYLRNVKGSQIVLDFYGNDSLPLAAAQEQVAYLRRLKEIGNFAILRGQVVRGEPSDAKAVGDALITATRQSDNKQFACTTGADGRYEFQPLPPGKYKITVRRIGSYKPDDSEIDLSSGSCWDLTLFRSPHARIAGHVKRSDGTPLPNVDIVLVSSDNSSYLTTQTDRDGQFLFDSQKTGRYVLGLNYPGRPDWLNGTGAGAGVKVPPASLYYPGVRNRSSARIVWLATDEQLDNLVFVVPVQ
jgi:hypothetical protein